MAAVWTGPPPHRGPSCPGNSALSTTTEFDHGESFDFENSKAEIRHDSLEFCHEHRIDGAKFIHVFDLIWRARCIYWGVSDTAWVVGYPYPKRSVCARIKCVRTFWGVGVSFACVYFGGIRAQRRRRRRGRIRREKGERVVYDDGDGER